MALKAKVQHDGKEIEVELPAGFLAEADVAGSFVPKDRVEAAVNAAAAAARKEAADKLLKDDEFRKRAAETWGLTTPAGGGGTPNLTPEQMASIRADVEKSFTPLKEKLDKAEAKNAALITRRLHGDLRVAAAAAGVKKRFLQAEGGGDPLIVAMLVNRFGYDPETDQHYLKQGDRFAISSKPQDGKLFKTVEEFMAEWAREKANEEFLDRQTQEGPGFQRPGGSGGPAVISRADARDHQKYTAALAAAQKAGVVLQVADT